MRVLLARVLLIVLCVVPALPSSHLAHPVAGAAPEPSLFPITDATGTWGYIDQTGQVVVPPRFDRAEPFSEGLALVVVGSRYGFIDATGAMVIAPTFPDAFPADQRRRGVDPRFSEGLALIVVGATYGYIDRTGKLLFTVNADEATAFSNGRAAVRLGKQYGYIDTTGAMVIPAQYAIAGAFSEGVAAVIPAAAGADAGGNTLTVHYINPAGQVVFSVPWTLAQGTGDALTIIVGSVLAENEERLSNGRAPFLRGTMWGYVDATGAEVIAPRFPLVQPFSEGLAVVQNGGTWGYIDPSGAFVIPARFSISGFPFFHGAARFSDGLAAVRADDPFDGAFGYIDRTGTLVIPEQYAAARPFSGGLALVTDTDGKGSGYIDTRGHVVWHSMPASPAVTTTPPSAALPLSFIDHSGAVVFSPQAEDAHSFKGGLAAVKTGGKWGYLDKTGAIVIPAQYATVDDFRDGRARVSDGKQWGWIDTTGQVIVPIQYAMTRSFVDGRAAVSDGKRWGWIDMTGQVVVPLQFDDVGAFVDGLAPVRVGKQWGYADTTGSVVIPPQWDRAANFSNGLAVVSVKSDQSSDNVGYIDRTGTVVIPLQYAGAGSFTGARAVVEQNGKWGAIDTSGAFVIPPQFDKGFFYSGNGLARVIVRELSGFVDMAGTFVVPPQYRDADYDFTEGLVAVQNDEGKWGYIDAAGTLVIGFQFDSAAAFVQGVAAVERGRHEECIRTSSNSETCTDVPGAMGYIDRTGSIVIPLQFTNAADFSEGLALVNRPKRR